MKKILGLLKDEQGQSMVEYGILVAIIAVGAVAALNALSKQIVDTFDAAKKGLEAVGPAR